VSPAFWLDDLLAFAAVALMLAGLYAMLKGFVRGRALAAVDRRLVTVLESTMLSQQSALFVIKVGARYLLVGGGNGSLSMLTELPAQDVEAWIVHERRSSVAARYFNSRST
jgi:flagellar biogenesis protein FliO